MAKTFLQPLVKEIDLWYREIGDKEYKFTSSETTPVPNSRNRTFYTHSFYLDDYYRHDRVVYEKLSREEIEKLFDSTIQKLTVDSTGITRLDPKI
jgi:murein L,D-transpeptidase YafK